MSADSRASLPRVLQPLERAMTKCFKKMAPAGRVLQPLEHFVIVLQPLKHFVIARLSRRLVATLTFAQHLGLK